MRGVGEGDGDADALLFAPGKGLGQRLQLAGQADRLQEPFGALPGLASRGAVQDQGDLYVLPGGEVGNEIAAGLLPDEADLAAAIVDELLFRHRDEVAAVDVRGAGARQVEAGEDVEQGGLAGSGGADDSHQLTAAHAEIQAAQRDDFQVGDLVDLEEILADDVEQVLGVAAGVADVGGRRVHPPRSVRTLLRHRHCSNPPARTRPAARFARRRVERRPGRPPRSYQGRPLAGSRRRPRLSPSRWPV